MDTKIKHACVRCKLKTDPIFTYSVALNHCSCYEYLAEACEMYPTVDPCKYDVEEGFILSNGDFVDREVALEIAKNANQLTPVYAKTECALLYSYMLDTSTLG